MRHRQPVSVDLAGFSPWAASSPAARRVHHQGATPQGARLIIHYPATPARRTSSWRRAWPRTTIIENASVEPGGGSGEFCAPWGAHLGGRHQVQVEGAHRLHGAAYRDARSHGGRHLALGALICGDVTLDGAVTPYLNALTSKCATPAPRWATRERYRVRVTRPLTGVDVQTYPYPGFPTDLQAPFATAMTQAQGACAIHETMFDGRLLYVSELRRMGARIDLSSGRTAIIHGPTPLRGTPVTALDIRSGAAMVLAGLAAEGTTHIATWCVDRDTRTWTRKLRSLGASIARARESTLAPRTTARSRWLDAPPWTTPRPGGGRCSVSDA